MSDDHVIDEYGDEHSDDHSDDHITVNRANWEARVPHHAASVEYGLDRYRRDPAHLSDVVRFDVPRLGDVAGLDGVHLQCHIGTDTLSLSRLGARMAGLDFSSGALQVARGLAADTGAEIEYVEGVVDEAVDLLGAGRFDLVYTGVGALCWLPDIEHWGRTVASLLRPGGRLHLREGHPVLWALDEPRPDGLLALEYPYSGATPVRWDSPVTYVEHAEELSHTETIEFNHGLGEIVMALLRAGMELELLEEHDSVPWAAMGDQMQLLANGEYRLIDRPARLPHSYTLRARKR